MIDVLITSQIDIVIKEQDLVILMIKSLLSDKFPEVKIVSSCIITRLVTTGLGDKLNGLVQ
jgi:hypothetical protein